MAPVDIADPKPQPAPPEEVDRRVDEPVAGILLAVAAMVLFAFSDAAAKYLSQSLPVLEIAWIRYAVFTALVAPVVLRQGTESLRSRMPGAQLVRGLGLLASSLCFILAVSYLPMADATATTFVSPLLTTALSIPLLGEKVGLRRWSAIVVGLIGVLIVVRPGTSAFNPASAFPLLSAISWSVAMVITRKMSSADGTTTTLAYSAGIGFAVLSVIMPFVWVAPDLRELGLGVFIGVASTAGQWLVVLAYRRASASLLAPYSYTQIVWSSVLGFVVFAAVPDAETFIGAAIIVASGLYTAHRERVVAREHPARPG